MILLNTEFVTHLGHVSEFLHFTYAKKEADARANHSKLVELIRDTARAERNGD